MTQTQIQTKVTIGVPAGAIPLPVNEDGDMTPWARSIASTRLPADATAEDVQRFADMLLGCTAESRDRGPKIMALAFCPDPRIGELARFEVADLHPSPRWPTLELKQLADFFAGPIHPAALVAPQVHYTDLPAGPAVRIRQQYVTAVGEDRTGRIMETVVYAIRPPETGAAVVLSVAWHALFYGERLMELADRLADSVRVV
ncbi:MAG: hypothetical protein ACJ786_06035 [Catenulispora sp.]